MEMTAHASVRCQQRAIPPMMLDLLRDFGAREPSGNGTCKVFFDKRARRRVASYVGPLKPSIEPYMDVYLVLNAEGETVTAAHRTKRINRI